jgi:hypothetical protein
MTSGLRARSGASGSTASRRRLTSRSAVRGAGTTGRRHDTAELGSTASRCSLTSRSAVRVAGATGRRHDTGDSRQDGVVIS